MAKKRSGTEEVKFMKWLNLVVCVCFLALGFSVVSAQREAPAGASDKGPADRGVKGRSAELERIKRDANKPDTKNQQEAATSPAKFHEIKEDFENLQLRQDEIVKAYKLGKQIDIGKIAQISDLMNKNAIRLEANLFPKVEEKKSKKKSSVPKAAEAEPAPLPLDLRSLIVEQDNTLASLVNNSMFVNPQIANVEDNARAHSDLKKLVRLTAAVKVEAEKRSN